MDESKLDTRFSPKVNPKSAAIERIEFLAQEAALAGGRDNDIKVSQFQALIRALETGKEPSSALNEAEQINVQ